MAQVKKITSYGWWGTVRNLFRFVAYLMIIVEGIRNIIDAIEQKDGYQPQDKI